MSAKDRKPEGVRLGSRQADGRIDDVDRVPADATKV